LRASGSVRPEIGWHGERRTPIGEHGRMWLSPIDAEGRILDRAVRGCRWRALPRSGIVAADGASSRGREPTRA
jgi:hypothetical protein